MIKTIIELSDLITSDNYRDYYLYRNGDSTYSFLKTKPTEKYNDKTYYKYDSQNYLEFPEVNISGRLIITTNDGLVGIIYSKDNKQYLVIYDILATDSATLYSNIKSDAEDIHYDKEYNERNHRTLYFENGITKKHKVYDDGTNIHFYIDMDYSNNIDENGYFKENNDGWSEKVNYIQLEKKGIIYIDSTNISSVEAIDKDNNKLDITIIPNNNYYDFHDNFLTGSTKSILEDSNIQFIRFNITDFTGTIEVN
jgi:hypothetical protein